MAKFRKKPIIVEAILCSEAIHAFLYEWKALPKWLKVAYNKGGIVAMDRGIYLPTLEGIMLANPDDWIICGVKGELYPCKADIFEATYESAEIPLVPETTNNYNLTIEHKDADSLKADFEIMKAMGNKVKE
jgi:hypothetical protein